MLKHLWAAALVCLLATPALADPPPTAAPSYRPGVSLQPTAIYKADGSLWDPSSGGSGGSSTVTGSQEQDVRSTGTLNAATANAAVTIGLNGQSTVGFAFSGLTASGAILTYEQSNDGGATWTGINEVNAGTGVLSGTRSTDGQVRVSVSGRTNLRVRVSTAGTGTITVAWNVSVREGIMSLGSPLPPGTNPLGSVSVTGANMARISCVLPAYASGGNIVCTDATGAQTSTACTANTACLLSAANPLRRYAFIMSATSGATVSYGYAATVAPGNSRALDGPQPGGGQGGFYEWSVPPTNPLYAASATAGATVVFEQGQ